MSTRARAGACALSVTALALAGAVGAPRGAQAAQGANHCPGLRGAPAAVDWGVNGAEQTAAGFRSAYENAPMPVHGLTNVRQAKVGFKFGLALLGDCTLRSWGSGNKSQLGNGAQQAENHPVPVVGLTEVKEIAVANAHAMALLYDGTVWTWGASEFGERGNHEKGFERVARVNEPQFFQPRDRPARVPGLAGVKQIAAGGTRDYALLASGEVLAWGDDRNGDLGVGQGPESCFGETHAVTPIPCSTIPRPVMSGSGNALGGVERIGAGEEAAFAVRSAGAEVLAWGNNAKGALGNGTVASSPVPVRASFEPGSRVVEIAGGAQHVLARLENGQVYGWGANGAGQLGFQAREEPGELCEGEPCSTIPVPIYALNHVVGTAAGESASFALKEEESGTRVVYTWGATGHWELFGLGNLPFETTPTPTPIMNLPSVAAVSASSTMGLALLEGGSPPLPRLTATPVESGLNLAWRLSSAEYKLRYRPAGTREFSPPEEATCSSPCEVSLTGLRPEPYELTLKTPEGREGREKIRRITATPLPAPGAPVNSSPPTLSGSPPTETGKLQQGQTVTAAPGSWTNHPASFSYQWLRCEGLGEAGASETLGTECEPITIGAGETPAVGESYVPGPADIGRTIAVEVKATNTHGWSAATSEAELVLAAGEESEPPAPRLISPPAISGAAVEGRLLSVHQGSWENEPRSYEERWFRCKGRNSEGTGAPCKAIQARNPATGKNEPVVAKTYSPTGEDVGLWVEVQETAENTGGWNVATSQAVQVAPRAAPVNELAPTITGILQQGQTLTAQEGTWSNVAANPAWQWLRCTATGGSCAARKGATKRTYVLGPEDVGHRLKVTETVENAAGTSKPASSAATKAVPVPASSPPQSKEPPRITGTPAQGETLTAVPGSWSNQPFAFTYQWQRCAAKCTPIEGASAGTYKLVAADVGRTLVLSEIATNAAGSTTAASKPSNVVSGRVPVNKLAPTINGNVQQGQTLSDFHGSWTNEPTGFEYQWRRCNSSGRRCKPISGATARTYTPTGNDVGATIQLAEAASNATGAGAAALSVPTPVVVPTAPANLTLPTVTGTGAVGRTLTEHPGSWTNAPAAFSVRWLRCEAGECHPIEGATHSTYTVTAADAGYAIAAREAASNAGGWSAAISIPTSPVSSLALAEGPPEGTVGEASVGGPGSDAFGGGLLDFSSAVTFPPAG